MISVHPTRKSLLDLRSMLFITLASIHVGCGSVSDTAKKTSSVQCSLQDERFSMSKFEAMTDLNVVRTGWLFGVGSGNSSREALSEASSVISAQLTVDVSSMTRVLESIDSEGGDTSRVAVDIRSKTSKRLKSVSLIATCTDPSTGKVTLVAGFDHQAMLKRASANYRRLADGWKILASQLHPSSGVVDLTKSSDLSEQLVETSKSTDFDELSPDQIRSLLRMERDASKRLGRLWSGLSVKTRHVSTLPNGRRIELVVSSEGMRVSGLELKPILKYGFGVANVVKPSGESGEMTVELSKVYANQNVTLRFERPRSARRFLRSYDTGQTVSLEIMPDEGFNVALEIDSKPLTDDSVAVSLINRWVQERLRPDLSSKNTLRLVVSTDEGNTIVLNNRPSLYRTITVALDSKLGHRLRIEKRVDASSDNTEGLEDAWQANAREFFRHGKFW